MTKYMITLEEVVKKQFTVHANSEEEVWEMITDEDGSHSPYIDGVEGIEFSELEDTGEYLDDRTEIEEIEE